MTTVLIAISDPSLRTACRRQLTAAGHASIEVERPLSLLSLSRRLQWDALYVDDSELGRSALKVAREAKPEGAIVGLGLSAPGTTRSLALPVTAAEIVDALNGAASARAAIAPSPRSLRLDAAGRRVLVGDTEVRLSVTEFRLLALLVDRSPAEVAIEEAVREVLGHSSTDEGTGALRVHIRNLRAKLASAGLPQAVQSRRGRGYVLVLPWG